MIVHYDGKLNVIILLNWKMIRDGSTKEGDTKYVVTRVAAEPGTLLLLRSVV
jgi:hypothetical protein